MGDTRNSRSGEPTLTRRKSLEQKEGKIMCMSIHQLVGEREALWDSNLMASLSLRGRSVVRFRV